MEDWYHLPPMTGAPDATYGTVPEFFDAWEGRYDYLTEPTHRTLDLLDELGVRATFFVVADIVDNYPELVPTIADRGHEIACHGLHHACAIDPDTKAPRFDTEEYRDRIREARNKLESASDQKVTGFRAPNGYVADWMLDVLSDLGFEYDSSVARNSIYNKTNSDLTNVSTVPYTPASGTLTPGGSRSLLEIPWPFLRVFRWRIPAGGGPLTRLVPERVLRAGIKQSLKRGPTVFYFHPLDLAREQFPVGSRFHRVFWQGQGQRAERTIRSILSAIDLARLTKCEDIKDRHQSTTT